MKPNVGVMALCIYLLTLFSVPALAIVERYSFPDVVKLKLDVRNVNKIVQDKDGFIWIGTDKGLYRFDGDDLVSIKLPSSKRAPNQALRITDIFIDKDELMWLSTNKAEVYAYNSENGQVKTFFLNVTKNETIPLMYSIVKTSSGEVYIGTADGLKVVRTNSNEIVPAKLLMNHLSKHSSVRKVFENDAQQLWIATLNNGAFRVPKNRGAKPTHVNASNVGKLRTIFEAKDGNIWAGANKGLFKYDPANNVFVAADFSHTSDKVNYRDPINHLSEDLSGNIWVAADHGAYTYDEGQSLAIELVDGKRTEYVTDILHDREGNKWLSSYYGVFSIDHNALAFDRIMINGKYAPVTTLHQTSDYVYFSSMNSVYRLNTTIQGQVELFANDVGNIEVIFQHSNGDVYLAKNQHGLLVYSHDAKFIREITGFSYEGVNISLSRITKILERDDGNLLIANFGQGGLLELAVNGSIENNYFTEKKIITLMRLKNDKYLLGTSSEGISVSNLKKNSYQKIKSDLTVPRNLMAYQLSPIETNKTLISLNAGIGEFSLSSRKFTIVNPKNLDREHVYNLVKGIGRKVWGTTTQRIFGYDQYTKTTRIIPKPSSLANSEFSYDSVTSVLDNQILMAGNMGLVLLNPHLLNSERHQNTDFKPTILITEFTKHKKPVGPSLNIDKDHRYTSHRLIKPIILEHDDYLISLKFSALLFGSDNNVRYQYMLEGIDSDWKYSEPSNRSARYSTLPKGEYKFRVRAVDQQIGLDIKELTINVSVKASPWLTIEAKLAYLVLGLILLWLLFRFRLYRLKSHAKSLEKKIKARTKELQLKNSKIVDLLENQKNMFENITHELKTPLTLIASPLEVIDIVQTTPNSKYLELIRRNTHRLSRLVDQILELARIESQTTFETEELNVKQRIFSLFEHFGDYASNRGIKTESYFEDNIYIKIQPHVVDLIVTNLLSNAVKYTPEGGLISIEVYKRSESLCIKVSDTGMGIKVDELDTIFDRFSRGKGAADHDVSGSGIGLALVKALCIEYKGNISVESELGKGSCFKVELPVVISFPLTAGKHKDIHSDLLDTNQAVRHDVYFPVNEDFINFKTEPAINKENKFSLLIVEDELDMRAFLYELFKDEYKCHVADTGMKGIEMAKQEKPDIILCDIMMPDIDGHEVSRQIRIDTSTRQIPIILLTAKDDRSHQVEGWRNQVDEYITKPFNVAELKLRVQSIIDMRFFLKETFRKSGETDVNTGQKDNHTVSTVDADFVRKFTEVIESNYDNSKLNISTIASKLFMHERQLQRRLKTTFSYSFQGYIKKVRLKKSKTLLDDGMRIEDVSDKVGFGSYTYFITCFREEYSITPKQYQKRSQLD